MTWQKLLGASHQELAAMNDKQLAEYFGDVLKITRPEQAVKPSSKTGQSSIARQKAAGVNDMLKGLGIDFKL